MTIERRHLQRRAAVAPLLERSLRLELNVSRSVERDRQSNAADRSRKVERLSVGRSVVWYGASSRTFASATTLNSGARAADVGVVTLEIDVGDDFSERDVL